MCGRGSNSKLVLNSASQKSANDVHELTKPITAASEMTCVEFEPPYVAVHLFYCSMSPETSIAMHLSDEAVAPARVRWQGFCRAKSQ